MLLQNLAISYNSYVPAPQRYTSNILDWFFCINALSILISCVVSSLFMEYESSDLSTSKGQWNSEWIYEVICLSQNANLKLQGFLSYQTNKDCSQKMTYSHQKITRKKCYDPCLYGSAEILVIFGLHFGRNDDLINSFWI